MQYKIQTGDATIPWRTIRCSLHASAAFRINKGFACPGYFIIYADAPRKSTDVCCLIIALLFGLALFILACVLINRSNLNRSNFPADTKGNICMLDTNQSYPFLYFADVANPNSNRYTAHNEGIA